MAAQPVREGLKALREAAHSPGDVTYHHLAEELRRSDEAIIGRLVDLRGDLHHHSKGRVLWHPDKSEHFRHDAQLLDALASRTALAQLEEAMFSPARNKKVVDSANEFGSGVSITATIKMRSPGGEHVHRIVMPEASSKLTVSKIQKACLHLTKSIPENNVGYTILSFQLVNEDDSGLLAEYVRAPNLGTVSSVTRSGGVRFEFRYTSRLKRNPLKPTPSNSSRLTRTMEVTVDPDADRRSLESVALADVLWRAEAAFWEQVTRIDLKTEVLEWEARLACGAVVSGLRIHLD